MKLFSRYIHIKYNVLDYLSLIKGKITHWYSLSYKPKDNFHWTLDFNGGYYRSLKSQEDQQKYINDLAWRRQQVYNSNDPEYQRIITEYRNSKSKKILT